MGEWKLNKRRGQIREQLRKQSRLHSFSLAVLGFSVVSFCGSLGFLVFLISGLSWLFAFTRKMDIQPNAYVVHY